MYSITFKSLMEVYLSLEHTNEKTIQLIVHKKIKFMPKNVLNGNHKMSS